MNCVDPRSTCTTCRRHRATIDGRTPGAWLGLVVLCALASLAAGPPASQPTPTTSPATQPMAMTAYTSDRFRLDYPADWTLLEKPVNHQVLSMQTQPVNRADQNLGVMGLRIDSGPDGATDEQILKVLSGGMVDYVFNHGAKNVTVKSDTLGDIPARRIRFDTDKTTDAGKRPATTTVIYIVAVHNRTEYVFTAAAPADQIAKMFPGVDAVVKSFRVLVFAPAQ